MTVLRLSDFSKSFYPCTIDQHQPTIIGVISSCKRPIKIILHQNPSSALHADIIVPSPEVNGMQFIIKQVQPAHTAYFGYKAGLVHPQQSSSVKQLQSSGELKQGQMSIIIFTVQFYV